MTRADAAQRRQVAAGIALKLAAVMVMGAMSALVKMAAERGADTFEIIFFRSAVALVLIGGFVLFTRGPDALRTRRPLGHVIRSTIGISGMICGFAALGMMPLGEFTAINFAAPLFITALSVPVLKERVGPHRWAAVLVGFVGVLIMVRPDPVHLVGLGPLLAMGQALGTAGAMLAIRQLGASEPGPTIAFYFSLASTIVGAVALPFVWTRPDPQLLAILVLAGLCGGVGQMLLSQAFRIAPAAVIAPFDYAALPWAALLGGLLWGERPTVAMVGGGAIVVASGLYIVWRETRRSR